MDPGMTPRSSVRARMAPFRVIHMAWPLWDSFTV